MSADGLTDTEREALTKAVDEWSRPKDSAEFGGDLVTDFLVSVVARIKAGAYQQGRADLAAKVEALADEIESLPTPYWLNPTMHTAWRQGVQDASDVARAILAADSTPTEARQ